MMSKKSFVISWPDVIGVHRYAKAISPTVNTAR